MCQSSLLITLPHLFQLRIRAGSGGAGSGGARGGRRHNIMGQNRIWHFHNNNYVYKFVLITQSFKNKSLFTYLMIWSFFDLADVQIPS